MAKRITHGWVHVQGIPEPLQVETIHEAEDDEPVEYVVPDLDELAPDEPVRSQYYPN